MKNIQIQTNKNLKTYFYLTHVKREQIGPLIQFLQKFKLNFRRIKNEKQTGSASSFLRQNANFMAQSSKPISLEEFQMLSQFLNAQTIVVGFEYGNTILNMPRTKMQSITNSTDSTWGLFNRVVF